MGKSTEHLEQWFAYIQRFWYQDFRTQNRSRYLNILNETGLLSNIFSSSNSRNSLSSIRDLLTSLWVAQSFLSKDKNSSCVPKPTCISFFSYDFLQHAGRSSAVPYNHLHIFKEIQIWLLALWVPCTNLANHHVKTKLMASVVGKWLDEALGDQQLN